MSITDEILWAGAPVFGAAIAGVDYLPRPGAYALILDAQQHLALMATPQGYYLPGGGCEAGESIEQTLQRELAEECGFRCVMMRFLGEATEYMHSSSEQRHFCKHGFFFLADRGEPVAPACEPGHVLEWHALADAVGLLVPASQRWAVAKFMATGGLR